jgi:hypothetical protein
MVVCLASLVALYCFDALRASTDVRNLIFVLPVSIVVLLLCLVQLSVVLRASHAATDAESGPSALPVIALFAAFVLCLPVLGFDIGTVVFVAAFLRLQGERRWPVILAWSIGLGLVLTYAFAALLPYAMPLRLLPMF